jgi:hypothetical protein
VYYSTLFRIFANENTQKQTNMTIIETTCGRIITKMPFETLLGYIQTADIATLTELVVECVMCNHIEKRFITSEREIHLFRQNISHMYDEPTCKNIEYIKVK